MAREEQKEDSEEQENMKKNKEYKYLKGKGMIMEKLIITSGYFNPPHRGHVEYLREAKNLGGCHIVIINNDRQVKNKSGRIFMPWEDRVALVEAFRFVDGVFLSVDEDETVHRSIERLFLDYQAEETIFANGGDRTTDEIPEAEICRRYNIRIVDGLGAKVQSSSYIRGLWRGGEFL